MIDKKELRIGNSVMCEGKILTVKAIEHNPVTDRWYVKVYENYSQIKCEYLEPIPITEELLVKMGFEHTHIEFVLDSEFQWNNNILRYNQRNIGIFLKCDYLHELQNAFKILTNQELTIEI